MTFPLHALLDCLQRSAAYGATAWLGGWIPALVTSQNLSSSLRSFRDTIPSLLWLIALAPSRADTALAATMLILPLFFYLRSEPPRPWILVLPLLGSAYLTATPLFQR